MGVWGTGLYSNDIALDIKSTYMGLLKEGKNKEEVERLTIEKYEEAMICDVEDDETIDAWLVLADLEWKYGRLSKRVKDKALNYIETGKALKVWGKCSKADYNKRQIVLEKLKVKILSSMPSEKKMCIPKPYECEWRLGDVFAYRLTSDYSKGKGVENNYMVFRVIQLDRVNYDNSVQPSFHVYKWMGKELPSLGMIYDEYLLSSLPSEYLKNSPDYLEKNSQDYYWSMYISSKRRIKKENISYLGNASIVSIPKQQIRYKHTTGDCLYEHLELYFIDRYLGWTAIEPIDTRMIDKDTIKIEPYQWQMGDTFAYKLDAISSKEKGLLNKYMLMRIVELLWDKEKEYVTPVIEVYQWIGEEIPSSEMIKKIPLLPMMHLEDPSHYDLSRNLERQILNYNMILDTIDEEDIKKEKLVYLANEQVTHLCSRQSRKKIEDTEYEWKSIEKVIVDRYLEWKDVDFITDKSKGILGFLELLLED